MLALRAVTVRVIVALGGSFMSQINVIFPFQFPMLRYQACIDRVLNRARRLR